MTDPPTPLTDDDLSAFLDGEADDALAARIEADRDAQARLAHLRSASDAIAATPVDPLEASVVDGLIATALAAARSDTETHATGATAGSTVEEPDATVHPLAPPPSRRRNSPSWLVAAGLVILVGIGLALVWSGTHSNDATTTDVAATATEASKAPSSKSAADSAADGDAGSASAATPDGAGSSAGGHASPTTIAPAAGTAAEVPVVPLGSFATPDALREALATSFPTEGSDEAGTDRAITATAIDRCAGLLQQILPVTGAPTHTGEATVAGKTVVVYEFAASNDGDGQPTTTGPAATTLTVAVHPEACDQVLAFQR